MSEPTADYLIRQNAADQAEREAQRAALAMQAERLAARDAADYILGTIDDMNHPERGLAFWMAVIYQVGERLPNRIKT